MKWGSHLVVAACLVPAAAFGQPGPVPPAAATPAARPPVRARTELSELRARVDELGKLLTDVPALQAQLRDIESLLLRVQAQLERIEAGGEPGRDAEARRVVDQLRSRIGDLRERVARLEYEARLRRDEGLGGDPQGPVVHSADGAFAVRLGARLKFRTEYLDPEQSDEQFGFQLRNAKLILGGHAFSPSLRFRIQTEFGLGQSPQPEPPLHPALEDYYMEYAAWAPWVSLRFGQFKVPFGRQRPTSSGALQFSDLAISTQHLELGRDIGLMLSGGLGEERLSWQLAALNGNGPNQVGNDNRELMVAGRVVLSPWGPVPLSEGDVVGRKSPRISLGESHAYTLAPTDIVARTGDPMADADQDGDGLTDSVAQTFMGLDATAHWRGASLQIEYMHRKDSAGAVRLFDTGHRQEYDGVVVQAGYFVVPARFETAFRASFVEPHGYGLSAEKRAQFPDTIRELALVLSYLRYEHHLKLQAEYAHLLSEGISTPPTDRSDHRLRLQLQLDF